MKVAGVAVSGLRSGPYRPGAVSSVGHNVWRSATRGNSSHAIHCVAYDTVATQAFPAQARQRVA